ncbi:MAG: heterodisulfide reductase-related iron-sulfur binding cluster [Candidatus Methanofastidiosia archaeon]
MTNDEFAFFLGCLIPNRLPMIEKASRLVCDKLGIHLYDMDGASCCPAPGVMKSFDKNLWLKLAARNLQISEKMGYDLITMCNGCYGTLKDASMELKEDKEKLSDVKETLNRLGLSFEKVPNVYHLVEYLYFDYGLDRIRETITNKLNLNVAVHYGCHLLKPVNYRRSKNFEAPQFFDELVEITGAKSISYSEKSTCCGAGGGVRSGIKDVSLEIAKRKVASIKGADCIVTPCPFCHMQLEQVSNIPVLYYTQLLALAMDIPKDILGLEVEL